MATSNSTQILIDTSKRVVVKRVGIFDSAGGDEAQTVFLDPRTLNGVLNANNQLYQSGNTVSSGFGANALALKRIVYNVDAEVGHLQLKWQGNTSANDKTIFALGVGAGDTNPNDNLPVIWNNAINPTGNVTIQTVGTTANAAYTVILEFHKNTSYFDAGWTKDPAAFNYGDYAVKP
jgi:hypothetical protein